MPGDHRVDVKRTSGDFVLNEGEDAEGRSRFGKQMRATLVLNVDGNES